MCDDEELKIPGSYDLSGVTNNTRSAPSGEAHGYITLGLTIFGNLLGRS